MVERINNNKINNDELLNLQYKPCVHISNLYAHNYHSILNPLSYPLNNTHLKSANQLITPMTKQKYLQEITHSWIAYHNQQSINPQVASAVEGCIFQIEFNSNAKYMAASNHYSTVEIWDTYSKKLHKTLKVHKEIVTGISMFKSPNMFSNVEAKYFDSDFEDEYILTSSLDKKIKLTRDLKIVQEYSQHHDWIKSLCVSNDKTSFLSGCISSVIKLWDIEKNKVCLTIKDDIGHKENTLNTVNTLNFFNDNDNLFVSAFRDGLIKIYDVREHRRYNTNGNSSVYSGNNNEEAVFQPSICFRAHSNKLNSVKLSKNNQFMLSSGRDNCGRLWDMRKLPSEISSIDDSKVVNTYKGHKCTGFNIEFSFFGKDEYAITGSEDGGIYIYDINNSENIRKYNTNERCVNIVRPVPDSRSYHSFVYAGLEHLHLFYCDQESQHNSKLQPIEEEEFNESEMENNNNNPNKEDKSNTNNSSNISASANKSNNNITKVNKNSYDYLRKYINYLDKNKKNKSQKKSDNYFEGIMEEVLSESGDMILKLIHSSNLSYSNDINYETLMDTITRNNDPKAKELLEILNQKLKEKLLENLTNKMTGKSTKNEEIKKNKLQEKEKIIHVMCGKCNSNNGECSNFFYENYNGVFNECKEEEDNSKNEDNEGLNEFPCMNTMFVLPNYKNLNMNLRISLL